MRATRGAALQASPQGSPQPLTSARQASRITFEGFEVLSAPVLAAVERALLARLDGSRAEIERAVVDLVVRTFHEYGYPHARVTVGFAAGPTRDAVRLILRAEPGVAGYFGRIDITGHRHVDDGVVRRYVAYRPGERFRGSLLRETERRLAAVELFERVTVQPLVTADLAAVPTRIAVSEGKRQRLMFQVGYGSEEKVSGEFRWRHRNLFGGARAAGLVGRWSALERGLGVDLNQPYLLSPLSALEASAGGSRRDEPTFRHESLGGRLVWVRRTVAHDLLGQVRAQTSVSLALTEEVQRTSLAGLEGRQVPTPEELAAVGLDPLRGQSEGWRATLSAAWRRRMGPAEDAARRTIVVGAQFEQAGAWLGGDFRYVEVAADAAARLPLGSTHALVARIRAATIDGAAVPFFKRYFLGGATSLRGWGRFELAPRSARVLPIGGLTRLEMTLEGEQRLTRRLDGAVFLDLGNAWARSWTVRLAEVAAAAGAGVRASTPFGPVRVDVGYQLTPTPDLFHDGPARRRRWRLHVSIGPQALP